MAGLAVFNLNIFWGECPPPKVFCLPQVLPNSFLEKRHLTYDTTSFILSIEQSWRCKNLEHNNTQCRLIERSSLVLVQLDQSLVIINEFTYLLVSGHVTIVLVRV